MYKITKAEAAHALMMETLRRSQELTQKMALFEKKYGTFSRFEKKVYAQPEDFTQWDDYMEWKACRQEYEECQTRLGELKRADLEIA